MSATTERFAGTNEHSIVPKTTERFAGTKDCFARTNEHRARISNSQSGWYVFYIDQLVCFVEEILQHDLLFGYFSLNQYSTGDESYQKIARSLLNINWLQKIVYIDILM